MRLKASCEDYRDDTKTLDMFTEESRPRRCWASPRVPMPAVVFDGEPEQQAQASKRETEDDLEWGMKGDPKSEPGYDQHIYTDLE